MHLARQRGPHCREHGSYKNHNFRSSTFIAYYDWREDLREEKINASLIDVYMHYPLGSLF